MAANNSITLLGNLGKDVELQYTQKGTARASFSLAVKRFGGGAETKTDWFDITIYGKSAEAAQKFLKKGSRVIVEGRLETYEYVGRDGQQRKGVAVVGTDWNFADTKGSSGGSASKSEDYEEEEEGGSNLPF